MRMLMYVEFPIEPFNASIRDGSTGQKIRQILAEIKPEAAYFSEYDGCRGGTLVVDVKEAADVPRLAEPFFLKFHAKVRFRVAMTPDDLGRANLDALGKKWG